MTVRTIGFPAVRRGLAVMAATAAALAVTGCGGEGSTAGHASAANAEPEVIDCAFDKPAVRPPNIIMACADLGLRVEQIQWKSWGPDRAEGDGVQHVNTCDPNCAAGNFVTEPVHIVLSDLVEPGHVFTKATATSANGKTLESPMTPR
ncbi:hypothetical protein [Nocardia blacklockiae]|uniref:hypothetical protein n=1 Tax=Nocardia blacklockiae TaxID=480036 RepID=UPI0018944446|nr:hypothetical protein [Nocardia blacklockiae]MBF6175238.1 hypothetical protein [Nocardia blacklockiae]